MTILSETPTRIVAHYLAQEGLGGFRTNIPQTEPGWLVVCGMFPDDTQGPDNVIGLDDNFLPRMEGKLMSGETIVKPSIQCRVRSDDRDVAYRRAYDIYSLLSPVHRETVVVNEKTFRIDNCSMTTQIVFMGFDVGGERPQWIFNFNLTAKEL